MTLSNERCVYITSAGAYLPGKPVGNDEIEDYLGLMGSKSGHLRKRMLASNGIETRYDALDKNGSTVELNQDLAAKAVLRALDGGARWIARAASNVSIDRFPMRSTFIEHAAHEHKDYQMIERDYCALGGTMEEMTETPENVGSEAISSLLFHHASQPDPVDLLGAMFVIEGLGKRKAAEWAARLRKALRLRDDQVSFLSYHGRNDEVHFDKLRNAIASAFVDRTAVERIVKTAKVTARLYVLQLEELDHF